MLKQYTCILCPRGCEVTAELDGKEIKSVTGNACKNGKKYVIQEITAPMRTIASSVVVLGGQLPLASVRTTEAIPKGMIMEAMKVIHQISVQAPVQAGQVLVEDLLGTKSQLIITKDVAAV